jgi:hypothetical protein
MVAPFAIPGSLRPDLKSVEALLELLDAVVGASAELPNQRLLQSRKRLVGSEALALRLALRIGMLAA